MLRGPPWADVALRRSRLPRIVLPVRLVEHLLKVVLPSTGKLFPRERIDGVAFVVHRNDVVACKLRADLQGTGDAEGRERKIKCCCEGWTLHISLQLPIKLTQDPLDVKSGARAIMAGPD